MTSQFLGLWLDKENEDLTFGGDSDGDVQDEIREIGSIHFGGLSLNGRRAGAT